MTERKHNRKHLLYLYYLKSQETNDTNENSLKDRWYKVWDPFWSNKGLDENKRRQYPLSGLCLECPWSQFS